MKSPKINFYITTLQYKEMPFKIVPIPLPYKASNVFITTKKEFVLYNGIVFTISDIYFDREITFNAFARDVIAEPAKQNCMVEFFIGMFIIMLLWLCTNLSLIFCCALIIPAFIIMGIIGLLKINRQQIAADKFNNSTIE